MIVYVHDESIDGRLCALATALSASDVPANIRPASDGQGLFFAEECPVETDSKAARSLIREVRATLSGPAVRHVMYTLLSELPDLDMPLYHYLHEGLLRGPEIDHWHANQHVKAIHEASAKVGREIHRLKGLLRFRELADGTLWAPMEPDHQVLLPLAGHFRHRLSGERGILHDLRRGMAVTWSKTGIDYISPPETPELADAEKAVQQLWQTYYRSSTIQDRINTQARRRFMPVRYWTWLTET